MRKLVVIRRFKKEERYKGHIINYDRVAGAYLVYVDRMLVPAKYGKDFQHKIRARQAAHRYINRRGT